MRDELVWEFATKEEAAAILEKARNLLNRYGRVTAAEIDNMIFGGYDPTDWTIGWRDLSYSVFRPPDDIYPTWRLVILNPVRLYGRNG